MKTMTGRVQSRAMFGSSSRRGSAYAAGLMSLPALLAMLALSIDLGMLCVAKGQLQNTADAAALAGAAELRFSVDPGAVRARAVAVGEANTVLGEPVDMHATGDVEIGYYDEYSGAWVCGWPDAGLPLVRATARRTGESAAGPVRTFFAPLFGVDKVDLTTTATAAVAGQRLTRAPVEMVIAQDASYSFQEELEMAKTSDIALVEVINNAAVEGDHIGVNRFRGSVDRVLNLTALEGGVSTVEAAVSGIYLGSDLASGTNTAAGLQDATDMLLNQASPDARRVIVLVSDGMPSGATYSETLALRRAAVDAADAAAAQGIVIHAVTFEQGNEGDAEFNASLVRNGGFAFHTPDPNDLQPILESVGHLEVGHPVLVD